MRWQYTAQEAASAIRIALHAGAQQEAQRIWDTYLSNDGRLSVDDRGYRHRMTNLASRGIAVNGDRVAVWPKE